MAEEEKNEETPAKGGKGKLIIIIVVVLLLVGGGGAFALMGGKDKKASHEEEEEVIHYETVELDSFIVNLADSGNFLKTTILIEYDPKLITLGDHGDGGGGGGHGGGASGGEEGGGGGGSLPGVLGKRLPMIRDAVITVLSSKKGEDLLSVAGKEALKEELVETINEAIGLDDPPVIAVYFQDFVVQ
jgi:flagellar protein FliL